PDAAFPNLDYLLKKAVACRNYFVHGSSESFDFNAIKDFVPFLTDALEFTFAAADLIEVGWDSSVWVKEPYGHGHSFARFRSGYREHLEQLKKVRKAPNAKSMV
ncbi:HEPN domain-containing protein, partial [Xanthomonas campestris]|uniref:HEPN domain-containing protein n=1 Tax=Xanthomonas campestris TaxID=339 RepID=UPI003558E322